MLCHGYGGDHFDMVVIQNIIQYLFPDCLVNCSICNEKRTGEDLDR